MLTLFLAMAQAAAEPRDAFASRAWGSFSRSPMLAHRGETVEFATGGRSGDVISYRLRRTRVSLSAPPARFWADSRTCPAVRTVLERLHALRLPAIVPPGFEPAPTGILLDGVAYSLNVPLEDRVGASRVSWKTNVGTPLATWVNESLKQLVPCWSPSP